MVWRLTYPYNICFLFLFNTFLFAEEPWSVNESAPVTRDALVEKRTEKPEDNFSISSILFHFYQKYLTDLDGSRCRYTPTCSVYSMWSVKKYGLIKGVIMSTDRLIRCHEGQTEYSFDPAVDY